jgi:hypothetical protein
MKSFSKFCCLLLWFWDYNTLQCCACKIDRLWDMVHSQFCLGPLLLGRWFVSLTPRLSLSLSLSLSLYIYIYIVILEWEIMWDQGKEPSIQHNKEVVTWPVSNNIYAMTFSSGWKSLAEQCCRTFTVNCSCSSCSSIIIDSHSSSLWIDVQHPREERERRNLDPPTIRIIIVDWW